jgi:hypothetical protein
MGHAGFLGYHHLDVLALQGCKASVAVGLAKLLEDAPPVPLGGVGEGAKIH